MKSTAYILVSLIFTVCCSLSKKPPEMADDETQLGDSIIIGVITLRDTFDDKDTITILNSDGSIWHRFSFRYDDSDGVYDFQNASFSPLVFNPDDYSFAATVVSQIGGKFEIIANEETRSKKFVILSQESALTFKTCSEFLTSSFAISYDEDSNPMLKSIAGERVKVMKSDNYLVRPLELKGNWLKVQHEDLSSEIKTEGWIRWRDTGRIIIQIHSD